MEQYHDLAPLNSPTSPVSLRPGARGPCNDDGVPHYCDRRPSAGALPQSRRSGRGARRRSADRCPAANDAGAGSRQRGDRAVGDPVDDAAMRRRFLAAFEAKHQIIPDGEDQAVLIVGEERWPFPIRLVRLNNTWRFNTQLASSEMVYRRIGRNEMSAIDACAVYVAAQKEYAEKGFAGKGVYARRFISRPGERDGLYWPAPSGEDGSPLGEFAASAAEQGYSVEGKRWAPYQGYYYKILTRQGPNAAGGDVDYMVSGNMVGGFALVAYPAQYRRSGLMTFLVNHQGTIYEKDLGLRTTDIGMEMTSFDPDDTWRRVKRAVQIEIKIMVSP